jgi:hypothetical protein
MQSINDSTIIAALKDMKENVLSPWCAHGFYKGSRQLQGIISHTSGSPHSRLTWTQLTILTQTLDVVSVLAALSRVEYLLTSDLGSHSRGSGA